MMLPRRRTLSPLARRCGLMLRDAKRLPELVRSLITDPVSAHILSADDAVLEDLGVYWLEHGPDGVWPARVLRGTAGDVAVSWWLMFEHAGQGAGVDLAVQVSPPDAINPEQAGAPGLARLLKGPGRSAAPTASDRPRAPSA